ncbi:cysteine desulfurase [Candidatus Uhrbacteria bacterium]|nr:cysteine desulfurase [Candidatus Uhrbacteria bacterium]
MSDSTGYFDYAASNPLWPEAQAATVEAMTVIGNPSSTHGFGRRVRKITDGCRKATADFLGVSPTGVIFTSGATEANNLAVFGLLRPVLEGFPDRRVSVLVSVLEHSSVSDSLRALAGESGHRLILGEMTLTEDAKVDLGDIEKTIGPDTVLVCLTAADNILGSIQPLAEVGELVGIERERRRRDGEELPLYLMSDAVQAAAWLPLKPQEWGLDAMVISGHKTGGPKGVGALWLNPETVGGKPNPLVFGGGQERGWRSGTENLPAIAGMAAALGKAVEIRETESRRCLGLRQRLIAGLSGTVPKMRVLGAPESGSLPGTVYLHVPETAGDVLAVRLDAGGFAVSAGSACDSGQRRPPAVLKAVYGDAVFRWGGVRVSFGRFTGEGDVEGLIRVFGRL